MKWRLAPVPWLRRAVKAVPGGIAGVGHGRPGDCHAERAARGASLCRLELEWRCFAKNHLGRSAAETAVVTAARAADRLLGVDLSYRFMTGAERIRELIAARGTGRRLRAELTFHNAYGPDKAWFYDRKLSGGGCVIDLGIHLVDLVLWVLGFPRGGQCYQPIV